MAIQIPDADILQCRLTPILSDYAKEKWMPMLIKIAGEQKDPLGILIHIQLSANDVLEGLPPIISNLPGHEFIVTKPLFAAFFPDEKTGQEEWEKLPPTVKGEAM
ncbi:hypothetical protein N7532_004771 [Penicillium argentinense]|uniref:Uncharacterized protein n=1 Tax=Penicillium argentinense TaxID=1131581 RepID=A0A9W9FQJ6_9EURO|nr:uncharacterized protein N7532_004771 [Penicillium argentinense]KAJ5104242.1 hypothetical protein N7532_004771 [Penicillium argentinense]